MRLKNMKPVVCVKKNFPRKNLKQLKIIFKAYKGIFLKKIMNPIEIFKEREL